MSKYTYAQSPVLVNIPNYQTETQLEKFETSITLERLFELSLNPLKGGFDTLHLCNIHGFIFEDVYEFAGEFRTEDILKGSTRFAHWRYIESSLEALFAELYKDIKNGVFTDETITERLSHYLTEINIIHPFREGNGRTQREFIRTLALRFGYDVDWRKVSKEEMMNASIQSLKDGGAFTEIFKKAITNKKLT